MTDDERNVVEYFNAVDGFTDAFYCENLVSDFPVRTKIDIRVFPAGRPDVLQLDFLQCPLTGGCLLGFGSVGRETGNEFLQLLDFFFLFLIGFLHLADQ